MSNPLTPEVNRKNRGFIKGEDMAVTPYVVNPLVKLPEWVRCMECKKGPTASDWLKPIHPNEKDCRHLIHLSHIKDGPKLSEEAGWIARNA